MLIYDTLTKKADTSSHVHQARGIAARDSLHERTKVCQVGQQLSRGAKVTYGPVTKLTL